MAGYKLFLENKETAFLPEPLIMIRLLSSYKTLAYLLLRFRLIRSEQSMDDIIFHFSLDTTYSSPRKRKWFDTVFSSLRTALSVCILFCLQHWCYAVLGKSSLQNLLQIFSSITAQDVCHLAARNNFFLFALTQIALFFIQA